jgi:hypothetical protein
MKSLLALVALTAVAHADDVPSLRLDLETFADADWMHRDGADVTQFRLDRGEAGATVGLASYAGAELRLESIRSGVAGGSAGIDGDSLVMRVKRAQIFARDLELGDFTIGGAMGVVPDPWISALETDYPLRPLSATASEGLLGWATGDLAVQGRIAYGPARLTVNIGNGEGLSYPERNDGKTTTGVLEVMPVDHLRIFAMGRDGSIGPARVRDQRLGGGATLSMPIASAGVELVRAYGVGDLGDVTAWTAAGWAELRPIDRVAFSLRGSTMRFDDGHRTSVGGAVAFAPPVKRATLRLWFAIDRTTSTGTADPVPALDPGTATTFLLIVSTTAPYVIP